MKNFHKIIALILLALAASSNAEIIVKKDRFDGRITINTKQDPELRDGIKFLGTVESQFIGKPRGKRPTNVSIVHMSLNRDWKYLRCSSFQWLVNDKPLAVGAVRHEGSVISGGSVLELVFLGTKIETLEIMALGSKVEYQICGDEFVLQPVEIDDLKEFIKQWKMTELPAGPG